MINQVFYCEDCALKVTLWFWKVIHELDCPVCHKPTVLRMAKKWKERRWVDVKAEEQPQ